MVFKISETVLYIYFDKNLNQSSVFIEKYDLRKLPVTDGQAAFFPGYSGFLQNTLLAIFYH